MGRYRWKEREREGERERRGVSNSHDSNSYFSRRANFNMILHNNLNHEMIIIMRVKKNTQLSTPLFANDDVFVLQISINLYHLTRYQSNMSVFGKKRRRKKLHETK